MFLFTLVEVIEMRFVLDRVYSDILFALWVIVLWGTIITEIAILNDSKDYIQHFTNWSLTFQAVFYSWDYLGRILQWANLPVGNHIRTTIVCGLWWMVNGIVWVVAVIVAIIIENNPSLITNQQDSISTGFVVDAHVLVHYVPGYFTLLYMLLERDTIGDAMKKYFVSSQPVMESMVVDGFFIFFLAFFTPVFPLVIYVAIFNPAQIYGITLSLAVVILIGIGVIIVTNILPFVIFTQYYCHTLHPSEKYK